MQLARGAGSLPLPLATSMDAATRMPRGRFPICQFVADFLDSRNGKEQNPFLVKNFPSPIKLAETCRLRKVGLQHLG